MPARTRKIRHDDETRAKIQASQLINRLRDHVLGKIELSPTQVRSAEVLLRKVLPDLAAVDVSGDIEHHFIARLPEPVDSVEAWEQRYRPMLPKPADA